MNQSMQPAIQHFFQVPTLEAVSREQLEKFVEEFPCFGFGHYLLSRKLRAENADEFLAATRKTSLYFSNPFWLQWMLENTEPAHTEKLVHREVFTHPGTPGHIIETIRIEEVVFDEEPPFVLDETDQTWPAMESPEAPAETMTLEADPDAPSSAAELLLESIEQAKALRESIIKINEDYQSHNGQPAPTDLPHPEPAEEPNREEPNREEPNREEPNREEPIRDEEPAIVMEEPDQPAPAPVAGTTAITEATPIFEPLHTIDYFASQGIRL